MVQQPAASCLELVVEDCVGQVVALHQGVCQLGVAAHHLLHCSPVEGQQLAQLEAQHQRQAACQDLLDAYLQEQPSCQCPGTEPCVEAETALTMASPPRAAAVNAWWGKGVADGV